MFSGYDRYLRGCWDLEDLLRVLVNAETLCRIFALMSGYWIFWVWFCFHRCVCCFMQRVANFSLSLHFRLRLGLFFIGRPNTHSLLALCGNGQN